MNRVAVFQEPFRDDLRHWARTDRATVLRILDLVEAVMRDPTTGIGKPERLRHFPNGWSRRITLEHRLVYRVVPDRIDFIQCRYHYTD